MGEILDALKKAEQESGRGHPLTEHARPTASPTHPPASVPTIPTGTPRGASTSPFVMISRDPDTSGTPAREVLLNPLSLASEAYRKLALKLRTKMHRHSIRSLIVAGALREEGKTTTSSNLALALASVAGEQRVALVCLDLHRPDLGHSLGITPEVELEKALRGELCIHDCRHYSDVPSLDIYFSSRGCTEPHTLLASNKFPRMIAALEAEYDFVIIDTPPVLLVPDTVIIADHVGGWILVARHGKTRIRNVQSAYDALPANSHMGMVLNESTPHKRTQQYESYYELTTDTNADKKEN